MAAFIVNRQDVYAGFVMNNSKFCRSMLFTIDENNLANDLIYTTHGRYAVEGYEPLEENDEEFILKETINLNLILKYMGYENELSQKDLNKIFRKLIVSPWWLKRQNILYRHNLNYQEELSKLNKIHDLSYKPYIEEPYYTLIEKRRK